MLQNMLFEKGKTRLMSNLGDSAKGKSSSGREGRQNLACGLRGCSRDGENPNTPIRQERAFTPVHRQQSNARLYDKLVYMKRIIYA